MAHNTSSPSCTSLFGEIATATWELLQKTWEAAKAYARWQSAEGWWARARAKAAYLAAGLQVKRAQGKVKDKWDHWKEHCVPQFG